MVLIHVKRSEEDQFLFETTCSEEVDTLIRYSMSRSSSSLFLIHVPPALKKVGISLKKHEKWELGLQ